MFEDGVGDTTTAFWLSTERRTAASTLRVCAHIIELIARVDNAVHFCLKIYRGWGEKGSEINKAGDRPPALTCYWLGSLQNKRLDYTVRQ